MPANYVIKELKFAALAAKKKGTEQISTDQLLSSLAILEDEIDNSARTPDTSSIEFDNNLAIEKSRQNHVTSMETYKTVNENGRLALKSLFIMNGGASIAMAAFIGNATKSTAANTLNLPTLSAALLFFAIGVLFAALAHSTNYICSFLYGDHDIPKIISWGHAFNILTICLAIIGYICFGLGLYRATVSFLI
jgi:hypothetical protein